MTLHKQSQEHSTDSDVELLKNEIAKLKYHIFTLTTLIGNLIDGEKVQSSIYEMVVFLDLSKEDLREAQQLISNYSGDILEFFQKLKVVRNEERKCKISEENIFILAQSFLNTGMMVEQCKQLLKDQPKLDNTLS